MDKVFFENDIEFINMLLIDKNNTGIVYCSSFRRAAYIRNEILLSLYELDELKNNINNTIYNNSINTIELKNNSRIIFLSKLDTNINYRITGLIIDKVLFKTYPNDDFFKYILMYTRK